MILFDVLFLLPSPVSVNIAYMDYPSKDELVSVYTGCFEATLSSAKLMDTKMRSPKELRRLAGTLVDLYEQVKARFSVDDYRKKS